MTTREASSTGEHGLDPVEAARVKFNRELLGEYHPDSLLSGFNGLQNAMLAAAGDPEGLYSELELLSQQAAEKAQIFSDEETAELFRGIQNGYRLTRAALTKAASEEKRTRPTDTGKLPSMAKAKGGF